MPQKRTTVPVANYLGLYARAWRRLSEDSTVVNLALFVLTKHLVIEKAKNSYKRKGQKANIIKQLEVIRSDADYASTFEASLKPGCELAGFDETFVKAGLI